MSDWQPIETAPKTGEWIIGFIPYSGDRSAHPYIVMRWCDVIFADDEPENFNGEWIASDDYGGRSVEEVTQWLPFKQNYQGPTPNTTDEIWPDIDDRDVSYFVMCAMVYSGLGGTSLNSLKWENYGIYRLIDLTGFGIKNLTKLPNIGKRRASAIADYLLMLGYRMEP